MKRIGRRNLPAISNLLAFSTAVRLGSITLAAREMSLTQSAVSKQLSELESFVGIQLVERTSSGIVPTVAGKEYLRRITRIIEDLDDATVDLMSTRGGGGDLNLSVVPSFATFWLLPRLSDFTKRHPDITVDITTRTGTPDLNTEGFDVAIITNAEPPDKYASDLIMGIEAYPVCAPSLIASRNVAALADIADLPLLHQSVFPDAWRDFLKSQGCETTSASTGPRYSILSLGLQAAISGLGCALLPDYLTGDAIDQGQLVKLSTSYFKPPHSYHLLYSSDRVQAPGISAFRNWLLETVGLPKA
ncbi:LysR family transcriptional regulator [Cupriavidus sp. 30B13]|uniref:LysR family transcriptional regulator n=1 Tax=Cupriavidus sp. 30B13 TaxID=3384241 RepID=UPI003B90921E